MGRGQLAPVGSVRVAKNGYSYTKVINPKTGKEIWKLTHWIIAEEQILKRPLADDERVSFIGSRKDLSVKNLRVVKKNVTSRQKQIDRYNDRIADLEDRRDHLIALEKKEAKK